MKKYILIISAVICSIILSACNNIESNDLKVVISKNIEGEQTVIDVTKENKERVVEIIYEIHWDTAKVQLSREPDFKIIIGTEDVTTYNIWLTNDYMEITIEGTDKYTKLDKGTSSSLLKLLNPLKKDTL